MNSVPFAGNQLRWSDAEKKVARRAFERALQRQCATILRNVRSMAAKAASPPELWDIHDYLSQRRRQVDAVYDYRYSRLLEVFSALLRDGWLHEDDLGGLSADKAAQIKLWART